MSKITNDRLTRSGIRMLCNFTHMAKVGIKGLSVVLRLSVPYLRLTLNRTAVETSVQIYGSLHRVSSNWDSFDD